MSDKKNVLYISYDGMTDSLGQSQVLPYMEGLSKRNYAFHLISFEKEERFEANKEMIEKRCEEAGIVWLPQKYTKSPPILSTIKDIRVAMRVAKKYHSQVDFDIIHCRSYIAAFVGIYFKNKYRTKFVFDMRGFWADERVDGNIWNLKNPVYKFVYNYFKRKERSFLTQADYVVSLTENGANEIKSWDYIDEKSFKIKVIPCCVDVDLFSRENINPHQLLALKKALKISEEDFVLGYVGSIGTWYMLDEMLDFFKVYSQNQKQAKFLFVTGENPDLILSQAKQKGIDTDRLIFTSTVHKFVPLHIALFDYAIFFIRSSYSKKASSPTKQGEIMAMGVPLICNAGVGDTDFVVKQFHSGKVLESLNPKAYQSVVLDKNEFDPKALRDGAISFFSLEQGVERFASIYEDVLNS